MKTPSSVRRCRLSAAALLGAALLCGCRAGTWSDPRFWFEPVLLGSNHIEKLRDPNRDESTAPREEPAAEQPAAAPSASTPVDLSSEMWARTLPGVTAEDLTAYRWHSPTLDWLIAIGPSRRGEYFEQLSKALTSDQPVVATNAAIVLARWGRADGAGQLASAVRNGQSKLPLRSAAGEALGNLHDEKSAGQLSRLLDELGDVHGGSAYIADLHAEMLYAKSRQSGASGDGRFAAALSNPLPAVKLAALQGLGRAAGPLPLEAVALRLDSDPRVRAEALRTIVVRRHPEAVDFLQRALNDYDLTVRLTAIAGLGQVGGELARQTLESLREHPSEASRVAVVTALAALGADESVVAAARDKSWRVRQAVAEALAQLPVEADTVRCETLAAAEELLRDASGEVRARAIATLATWPLEQGGPLLLAAMDEGSFPLRKSAAQALAARWPAAAEFQPDAPEDRRRQLVADLRRRFASEHGTTRDALLAAASARLSEATGIDVNQVRAAASQYTATIERLRTANPADRRAAIAELVNRAAGQPLPAETLDELLSIVQRDSDPAVWQQALTAIRQDARESAFHLAYMAIGHASAEVRRRAADYLAAHADPRHLAVLLPALADPDAAVVIAALGAVAAAGAIDDPRPIVELLASPDRQVRLAAARCAARLRIESGLAALERLALDTDHEIRRAAAIAMGELAEPGFIASLVGLLDDRSDVQQAALVALPKIVGRDIAAEPDSRTTLPPAEQARRWKAWAREQAPAPRPSP